MFNNLIESSSHVREFKRRGLFVLFTTATYALFFIVAGVISIYAYDARLEDQNTEFVTMLSPVELPAAPLARREAAPPRNNNNAPSHAVREVAMSRADQPEVVPTTVSAAANKNLPIPKTGAYTIGGPDSDPVEPGGTGRTGPAGNSTGDTGRALAIDVGTPPPAQPPVERQVPRVISKGVITGLALALPKPTYPPIAIQAGARGAVAVQVLIDESGTVISAKAVSGHPLLLAAAQQAAYRARFSPTKLGEQPVKVSGVITYNFVRQ